MKAALPHHPVAPSVTYFPFVFGCIRLFY